MLKRLLWHKKYINLPQCVAVVLTLLEMIYFDLDVIKNYSRRNLGRVTSEQNCVKRGERGEERRGK